MQVISKLLDPKTSEHTASFVGRLVSIVITKVGNQLGENLDLMLRLVLSKMQQAETLSVMEVLSLSGSTLHNLKTITLLNDSFVTTFGLPQQYFMKKHCSK